ncbi:NUDIX domain-containing protein [Paroceanicella profunda]|uniref:NUDIX domain-containing protein n=1 Tax=Paroceanicella profunda TaxID=2579971 RepID=UPI001478E756|nr:NUDIX domain-containing protein [Paroceanicella profunda]
MSRPIFLYGTLRDPRVLETVAGPGAAGLRLRPAHCRDHLARRVEGTGYPVLRPTPGALAEGLLLEDAGEEVLARLSFFEDGFGYTLVPVPVLTRDGETEALAWLNPGDTLPLGPRWDFAAWAREDQPVFLESVREYMAFMERGAAAAALWHGVSIRARARVSAAAETPVQRLRSGFTREDVELLSLTRPYANYFAIEEHTLRFRRFDGSLSAPMLRAAFTSGDAVTVLPWDPGTDHVLVIEQFRTAPWARGDKAPWTIETVAGRCDSSESAEEAARREAREEAGLELGRMERVAAYYPSPGAAAEFLTSFVAQAELGGAGGVHGLEIEGEDIRAFTLPLDDALAAVRSGEIANGPLVLSLFWLAAQRETLRAAWGA